MQFTTTAGNEFVDLRFTAPTVVEPGDTIEAQLELTFHKDISFLHTSIGFPDSLTMEEIEGLNQPRDFNAGDQLNMVVIFETDKFQEDFGLIQLLFAFQIGTEKVVLEKDVWISIFKMAKAAVEELSFELRQRLLNVVNFRPTNGHIFLADYNSFFEHFLNIIVPESVREFLAEEFGLPNEGLPVDPETYWQIIGGDITFYGIEQLELIAEEDCNESDDRFDATGVREVKTVEV